MLRQKGFRETGLPNLELGQGVPADPCTGLRTGRGRCDLLRVERFHTSWRGESTDLRPPHPIPQFPT